MRFDEIRCCDQIWARDLFFVYFSEELWVLDFRFFFVGFGFDFDFDEIQM